MTAVVDQKIVDELREAIGCDVTLEPTAFGNTEGTRDSFRHFADGTGDFNPLWRDEQYAGASRFGGVIAPPVWLTTVVQPLSLGLSFRPNGWKGLDGDVSWRFHSPVRPGDRISVTGRITDVVEKTTRSLGAAILVSSSVDYRNQNDDSIAEGSAKVWFFPGGESGARSAPKAPQELAPDPMPLMADDAVRATERRGAVPRFWEDVSEGEQAVHVRPTLTPNELLAWCVGGHTTGWARLVQRRIASGDTSEWDSMMITGPVRHLDSSLARADGLPGAFDIGAQRTAWLGQLMTDWIGDAGDLVELSCRYGRLVFVGDTPTCAATVTHKYRDGDRHLVALDLEVRTHRGDVVSTGSALVALPSRADATTPSM
ncbi:MaoC family dehydratase [Rhodococcus rhodochrous]|uniref:MaoC family dehydratase n=1 Tax=Rhodococcus rhodochrous TaxID=1829 RepID=UPI0002F2EC92|nr:MaoC family dehydratase N-terminal domain-containing protein [Rhodococcus rhodochrous]